LGDLRALAGESISAKKKKKNLTLHICHLLQLHVSRRKARRWVRSALRARSEKTRDSLSHKRERVSPPRARLADQSRPIEGRGIALASTCARGDAIHDVVRTTRIDGALCTRKHGSQQECADHRQWPHKIGNQLLLETSNTTPTACGKPQDGDCGGEEGLLCRPHDVPEAIWLGGPRGWSGGGQVSR